MGQLTQTTAQVQVILDDADAANVGKTSLTDSTDTTAVAVKKSGFYSLGASSSNAPSTDRAILISAVRDTAATGEIRYGQVAITESNGMWWNRDDGGALGTWYEAVSTAGTQTLTNKTLTSPVLTTPQINDTSADHQYIFAVSELVADRTVTLPLLTGNDTFVFAAHTQTLTNKTLTSPVFNTGVSGSAVLDDDNFLTASSTTLATSESIKAYVDAKVTGEDLDFAGDTGTGAVDLDSQVFTIAGTANEIETSATSQTLTIGLPNSVTITTALSVDTISEKTAAAGVTVDSLLIKDGGITAAGTSTFAGQTISDLGTVTTANIDGGSIDGTTIGASTAAAITGTTITATDDVTLTGASYNVVWDSSDSALEFADNAKAVFGAGSDLQIYHDGTSNIFAGDIVIDGSDASTSIASPAALSLKAGDANNEYSTLRLATSADGSLAMIGAKATTTGAYPNSVGQLEFAVQNGASTNTVLTVTSTGIDVTGTVVSNGLTLENNAEYLSVKNSSGTSTRAFGVNSGNNLYIGGIDADIGPILFVDNGATLATLGPTGLDVNGTVTATGDFLTSTGMQVSGHPVVGYAAITGGYAARLGSTGTSTLNETQIYAGGNFVATFQRGGNVGIGLGGASPQQLLHINGGAADTAFQITNSASGSTATDGFSITVENPTPDVVLRNRESSNMRFLTANTERIRISSTGNVTINSSGTIPTGVLLGRQLVVGSATGSEIIAFREDTDVAVGDISGALLIGNSDIDGVEDHFVGMWGKVSSTNGSQDLHFAAGRSSYESDTPQMTLDSSGDLLVGVTSAGADGGVTLSNTGYIQARINNDTVAYLDRTGVGGNGEIIRLQQNGSTVGSIGVKQSDAATGDGELIVASGNTGLFFDDVNNYIRPANASGALRDNTVDLGEPDSRFKDLYLSGRARAAGSTGFPAFASVTDTDTGMNPDGAGNIQFSLQGVEVARFDGDGLKMASGKGIKFDAYASGNVLDDYEEGTSSATSVAGITATTNTVSGRYTKIGNTVIEHFQVAISGKSGGSGNPYVSLSFTPSGNQGTSVMQGGSIGMDSVIGASLAYMGIYGSAASVYANTLLGGYIGQASWTDGQLCFTVIYETN